jgi:hypothetical protein
MTVARGPSHCMASRPWFAQVLLCEIPKPKSQIPTNSNSKSQSSIAATKWRSVSGFKFQVSSFKWEASPANLKRET